MQMVFIFTHLMMAGAVIALFFTALRAEQETGPGYSIVLLNPTSIFLTKLKVFRCSLKSRALMLSGRIARLKIADRADRSTGHTI